MSPTEIALLVTALGGGTGISLLVNALRANTPKRVRVESSAVSSLISERDAAKESEREAWQRADAMEERYDRMTASRNRWRERSHRQDAWVIANCRQPDDEYPAKIEEDQ